MSEDQKPTIQLPLNFPIDGSEKIEKLCEALSQAQGEFPTIPKNSEVEVYSKPPDRRLLYKYKYADLTEIINCTRPHLTKYGLSFTQDFIKHRFLGVGIVTILFHKTGQYMRTGFVPCEVKNPNMKEVAGQFTYGKRISLTAALGVSADEDVDAGSIEGETGNTTERKDTRKPSPKAPPQKKKPAPPQEPPEPDPFPNYEEPPKTKLDQLYDLVKSKKIGKDAMPEIIKRAVGERKRSTDLTPDQIDSVIKYVNLLTGKA